MKIIVFLCCFFACGIACAQWGLIRVPVANLHKTGNFSAEMVSQAIIGTPVRIVTNADWKQIETPDGYTGWVHRGQVFPQTAAALTNWNNAPKVVVTALEAPVTNEQGQNVTLLPGAAHVRLLGEQNHYWHIALPDGRQGFIPRSAGEKLSDFRARQQQKRFDGTGIADLVTTAQRLKGRSYLWAGASAFAMDCSGFVQTVWRMNDLILPRDASQQALCGHATPVAQNPVPNLQSGDLLFFGVSGQTPQINHVGISLGGARFIHSLGDVHVASLDPNDPDYDAKEAARYLGAQTLSFDDSCVTPTANHPFYGDIATLN